MKIKKGTAVVIVGLAALAAAPVVATQIALSPLRYTANFVKGARKVISDFWQEKVEES